MNITPRYFSICFYENEVRIATCRAPWLVFLESQNASAFLCQFFRHWDFLFKPAASKNTILSLKDVLESRFAFPVVGGFIRK